MQSPKKHYRLPDSAQGGMRGRLTIGVELQVRNILIATGSKATKAPIEGNELGIISDEVLALEQLPKRLASYSCNPHLHKPTQRISKTQPSTTKGMCAFLALFSIIGTTAGRKQSRVQKLLHGKLHVLFVASIHITCKVLKEKS